VTKIEDANLAVAFADLIVDVVASPTQ